jgi:hypothetical protein
LNLLRNSANARTRRTRAGVRPRSSVRALEHMVEETANGGGEPVTVEFEGVELETGVEE